MDGVLKEAIGKRYFRHVIFWVAWVFGFTFIKSFGAAFHAYLAWFTYYIFTLPVFVLHTYLIVYWAGRKYFNGWKIFIFAIIFLGLLYLLSFIEMYITEAILKPWFPEVFIEANNYKSPVQVAIGGVGNLYILLVFIASKQLRTWYIATDEERKLSEKKLQDLKAAASAGLQPNLLLFVIREIERHSEKDRKSASEAISSLSELLGQLIRANELNSIRTDEELMNVKRLLSLYGMLFQINPPGIRVHGDHLKDTYLSSFIIFSPIEIMCRFFRSLPRNHVQITIDNDGSVEILAEMASEDGTLVHRINKEMEQLFPGKFNINGTQTGKQFAVSVKTATN